MLAIYVVASMIHQVIKHILWDPNLTCKGRNEEIQPMFSAQSKRDAGCGNVDPTAGHPSILTYEQPGGITLFRRLLPCYFSRIITMRVREHCTE
jgi:hypothetical protein